MTRPEAKVAERRALDLVLAHLKISDAPNEREEPDFELSVDGKSIGIEVTELADPRIAKGTAALKKLQARIVERLRGEQLDAAVHLAIPEGFGALLASPVVQKQHVDGIVAIVRAFLSSGLPRQELELEEMRKYGIAYLADVTLSPGSSVTTGHRARGRHSNFVQDCINAKNEKAEVYRANVPGESWLVLIVGEAFRSAVDLRVLEFHEYATEFDRTFCVDTYTKEVVELTTRRAKSAK